MAHDPDKALPVCRRSGVGLDDCKHPDCVGPQPYRKVYRQQRFTIEISAMVPPEVDQAQFRADWLAVIREHLCDRWGDSFSIRVKPRMSAKWEQRLVTALLLVIVSPIAFYYGSHHAS